MELGTSRQCCSKDVPFDPFSNCRMPFGKCCMTDVVHYFATVAYQGHGVPSGSKVSGQLGPVPLQTSGASHG